MRVHEFDKRNTNVLEIAALFEALALHQDILQEGNLDEASAWEIIRDKVGSATMQGVKSAADAVNRLNKLIYSSKPVAGFDEKADKLLLAIGQKLEKKFPSLTDKLQRFVLLGKKRPIAQAFILGGMTAIIALSAGTLTASAIGLILGTLSEYLSGNRLSKSLSKGVQTAVLGAGLAWLAGFSIDAIGEALRSSAPSVQKIPGVPELVAYQQAFYFDSEMLFGIKTVVPIDYADSLKELGDQFVGNLSGNAVEQARSTEALGKIKDILLNPAVEAEIQRAVQDKNGIALTVQELQKFDQETTARIDELRRVLKQMSSKEPA